MKELSGLLLQRRSLITVLLDISALAFVFFVPAISHLISLPIYLIEPMRLMLILSLVHTTKKNAYLLALTLPLFSFIISAHPELPKMILIVLELSLNVFLFYLFVNKIKQFFLSILLSIIISKIFYYITKFSLIKLAVINSELFSTPIYIQVVTTLLYGAYVFLFFKKQTE